MAIHSETILRMRQRFGQEIDTKASGITLPTSWTIFPTEMCAVDSAVMSAIGSENLPISEGSGESHEN